MKNNLLSKSKWLFLAVFFMAVSACTGLKAAPTAMPAATVVSNVSKTALSPVILPTPSSTPVVTKVDNTCWNVNDFIETRPNIENGLVYYDDDQKQNMLLNLGSLEKNELNDFSNSSIISPDGSVFINMNYDENELVITSATGSKSFQIPADVYFGGFLSNNQIRLAVQRSEFDNYVEGKGTTDKFYVLSLSSGDLTPFSVWLPYFYTNIPYLTRIQTHISSNDEYIVYSSDLNYVLYSSSPPNGWNILFDLKTSQIVWSGGQPYDSRHVRVPSWKPDGSAFTLVLPNNDARFLNFHNIDTAGNDVQLTFIEKTLGESYSLNTWNTPQWSYDGRYMAFTLSSGTKRSLFIYDSQTDTLIDLCLSEDLNESLRIYVPLYWSPTKDQLALTMGGKAHWKWVDPSVDKADFIVDVKPDLLVLDITSREIYKFPEKTVSLFGWLSWETP